MHKACIYTLPVSNAIGRSHALLMGMELGGGEGEEGVNRANAYDRGGSEGSFVFTSWLVGANDFNFV